MEAIKTSENVEFDVIYADGTRRRVREGVLFEVENEKMIFHNGTNRASVLFAAAETLVEVVKAAGLEDAFVRYIDEVFGEGGQDDAEGKQ